MTRPRLLTTTTRTPLASRIRSPCKRRCAFGTTPAAPPRNFTARAYSCLGISMFPPLLASLAMAKEGEQKTILQVYVSSISAHEFLLGKIFAFMIVAFAEAC